MASLGTGAPPTRFLPTTSSGHHAPPPSPPPSPPPPPPPSPVGTSPATSIALGGWHSCALLTDGAINCWGDNGYGKLGDGTTTDSTNPVKVSGISTATSIALDGLHSCALLSGGAIKCWGWNYHGQLGDGTTIERTIPVEVSDISTATSIALGGEHSCALLTGGAIKCWGKNLVWPARGRDLHGPHHPRRSVGYMHSNGHRSGLRTLVRPADGRRDQVLGQERLWPARGPDHHRHQQHHPRQCVGDLHSNEYCSGRRTLVRPAEGGAIKCWGYNGYGQVGDGTTISSTTPVNVTGITTATSIALGGEHSCALLSGGAIKCWGWNYHGQLGDGTTIERTTPVEVSGISTATSIALGGEHSCALLTGGAIKCWGSNSNGRLGDGTTTDSTYPVDVIGLYAPPPSPPSVFSATTSFSLIISLFAAFALNALFA